MAVDGPVAQRIAQAAVAEQVRWYDHVREIFRRNSRQRTRTFHEPFVLGIDDLNRLNATVRSEVDRVEEGIPITFEAVLRLADQTEVPLPSWEHLATWNEPERSHPVRITMTWTYVHTPLSIPAALHYDIVLDYETEPSVRDKMSLGIEEEVICKVEGPSYDWVRLASESILADVEATWMPLWWRGLRRFITFLKPFISQMLWVFVVGISFVSIYFTVMNSTATSMVQDVTTNPDVAAKIDRYVRYVESTTSVHVFGPYVVALCAGAAAYFLLSVLWRHLAPPSMILIGRSAGRRRLMLNAYGVVWLLAVSTVAAAIASRLI